MSEPLEPHDTIGPVRLHLRPVTDARWRGRSERVRLKRALKRLLESYGWRAEEVRWPLPMPVVYPGGEYI